MCLYEIVCVSVPMSPACLRPPRPRSNRPPIAPTPATEVRCQEKSGGLAYEVILATPSTEPPPVVTSPPAKPTPTTDEINKRLLAAEERKKVRPSSGREGRGEGRGGRW